MLVSDQGSRKIDDLKGLRATYEDAVIPTVVIEAVNSSLESGGQWVHIDANSLVM